MLGIKKRRSEESITEESVMRAALASRGMKRREADEWLADMTDTVPEEPFAPSEAYVTHVLAEEGVTEADMEWYWNGLTRSVHAFFKKLADLDSMALFITLMETQGPDLAAAGVRRRHAYYGDPRSPAFEGLAHEDRLLPWDLKDRVDTYIQRRAAENLNELAQDQDASSTFNALIRSEIAAGRL